MMCCKLIETITTKDFILVSFLFSNCKHEIYNKTIEADKMS